MDDSAVVFTDDIDSKFLRPSATLQDHFTHDHILALQFVGVTFNTLRREAHSIDERSVRRLYIFYIDLNVLADDSCCCRRTLTLPFCSHISACVRESTLESK